MKRGGSVASYARLIERLRSAMPDIAIRTTFLVGFPGEDDTAFEQLKQFVQMSQFDRLGVFTYSPEDGTPGYDLRPRVLKRVAEARRNELMALQQPISLARNQALLGQEFDVLVEGRRGDDWIARSFRDAPEIDGVVLVRGNKSEQNKSEQKVALGEWRRVRITEAHPYDLIATV
jgi:ribosomal protein S12 methylthiotransferase